MQLAVLFLLPLVAAAPFYEIHGYLSSIKVDDLAPESYTRHSEALRSQLQTSLSSKFVSSAIYDIKIHGEDVGKPTAIFYAYLETTQKIDATALQKSTEMELFLFRERRDEESGTSSFSGTNWLEMMRTERTADSGIDVRIICVNGGLALPNNTCACPAFYTGANCQIANCLNGGIADDNRCACPPGHYSVNCEPRGCLPAIQDRFDNSKQTFILVLNQRSTMAYVLNNVIVGISDVLGQIDNMQQNLIDNYILVNYVYTNSGAYYMNQKYADNRADFLNYVQGVTAVDGPAQQYTNRALYSAQNFAAYMHGFSNIFIFSDATDISGGAPQYVVSSTGDEITAITQTIAWRNRPVYLLSQMKGMPIPSAGSDYDTYRRVAAATLGDIITFDMLEVIDILMQVIPRYLQNENIAVTYQSTVSSLLVPPGDTSNITILVTVDPNFTVPDVSHSAGATVIASGARYALLSAGNTFGFLNVTSTSPYSARVWVNSGSTALLGYSTDPLIDIGSSYITAELAPYVSAGPIGWTGAVSYALVDNNGKITVPMAANTAVPRTSAGECSFSLSFGPFTSTLQPGNQMVHLTLGNAIRIVPGFAGQLDYHSAIPFNCFNNGTRVGPSTCQCPPEFEGSNCATPVCFNNGKVNPFPGNGNPLCLCPTGYSGDHCDLLQCPIAPGPEYPFSSQRSLAFVIQNSMSQAWVNTNMYTGLANMLAGLTGTNQFSEYLQTIFNNIIRNGQNYTQILSHSTTDKDEFLYSMESDNLQYMATASSTQDSLGALYKTINLLDNDKSSIFIFLDAAPQSAFSEYDIIDAAVSRQLEINFVITPPYAMAELCMSTGDSGIYREISQKTGGIYLNLCNKYGNYSNDPIVQFLTAYGASHHHTENLNEALTVGVATASIDFKVDNPNDEVYGFVNCENGETFTATLTNKDTGDSVPLMSITAMPFVGIYRITPAYDNVAGYTLSTTTNGGYCSVRVAEKTLNALYLGFAQNPGQNFRAATLLYGVPTSPVAHPYAGSYLINATSISLTVATDDGQVLYQNNGTKRSYCEFDFYFKDPFVCQTLYSTFVFTTSVTTSVGQFQRTQRGFCYQPQQTCLNGGTYDADDYRCNCANDWTGDFCELPICQNSGTVKDFACVCAADYTGQFCQYGSCQQWNFMETNDVRQTTYKQVTFVVNRNQGQLVVNVMLDQVLKSIFQYKNETNVPLQYSLIQFDEDGYYDIISTVHFHKFLDAFHNSINTVTRTNPTQTQSLAALYESYKLNIQPPDIVCVVTGTDAKLNSGNLKAVLRQKLGTQINLIYTPPQQNYPAQPTGNLAYVAQIARQTGGRVWPVTQNGVGNLGDSLYSMLFEDALVMDDAVQTCTGGANFTFFIESVYNRVVIEVTGNSVSANGNLRFWDGSGAEGEYITMFKDNAAMVVRASPYSIQGTWKVQVTSASGPCFIQVRAQSPIRVIPGFTSSPTSDFVKDGPFTPYGTNPTTYMTFRVIDDNINYTDRATSLTTLSIFHTQYYQSWKPDDTKHTLDVAITKRDPANCASQFMATWQMEKYGYQKFVVTGTDTDNVQFQRTFYFNMPDASDTSTCVHGTRNSYGECNCDVRYKGNYCNERICQNGGSSSYGICACVNGYFDDFCTQYIIDPGNATMSPVDERF